MKTTDSAELYILLDGTYASAGDCSKGDDGVMRGSNGVPVAMTDEGEPMTVARQVEMGGNALAAHMGKPDEAEPVEAMDDPEAHEHVVTAESMAPAQSSMDEKPVDVQPAPSVPTYGMPSPVAKPEPKADEPKVDEPKAE